MNLQSVSVRTKLTLGFSILALLLMGITALAVLRLSEENQRFTHYVTYDEARVRLSRQLLEATQRRAIAARNMLISKDSGQLLAEKADVDVAHRDVRNHMNDLKKLAVADADAGMPTGLTLFNDLERIESRYGAVALNIVQTIVDGQRAKAEDQMNAECRPLLVQLTRAAEKFVEYSVSRRTADREEAQSLHQSAKQQLMLIAALSLLTAVGLVVFITRSIVRSLGADPNRLAEVAARIAGGDLGESAATQGEAGGRAAPAGSVLAAMEHMQVNLRRIVSEVRSGSDSIATASREIAQGNLDLSARTEQQAASLQQTAASMQELGSTVRRNADTARQASQLAANASATAHTGGNVVTEVVQTMRDIDESSHKIASIISVIDGIAFQTNILALNAAVEAARAGEQGRGFAVVAGEVRNLAQRSASAAKEIKGLIEDSVQRVERGAALADKAGATMNEIVAEIRQVADLMTEISTATSEQTDGVLQVGQAVSQMDQATQQNAALVEEGAAAAEGLREQAQRLVSLVAAFRLEQVAMVHDYASMVTTQAIDRAASSSVLPPVRKHAKVAVAQRATAAAGQADDEWAQF
jgi:methyl-accepting chemotaxis protein-1 (serine sensor receptor)